MAIFPLERRRSAIAAPVWHELLYRMHRTPSARKRMVVQRYLEEAVAACIPILPYDERAATIHAVERARLAARGATPAFVDGQIAAIAIAHELTLVTRNTKDFAPFRGLRLANWFKQLQMTVRDSVTYHTGVRLAARA